MMTNCRGIIVTGALAAALGATSPLATAQPASPDLRELKAYVLTMDVINKLAKANKAAAATLAKDPKRQKLAKQKAELKALEAKEAPTDAEQERMSVLADEISRFEDDDDAGDDQYDTSTITGYARRVDAAPASANAVHAAGLSSREYATAMLALVQAGITWGLLKDKLLKQAPPDVSPQNIEFVRQHEKEIAALGVLAQGDD